VYNADVGPVDYTVRATEFTNSTVNIIPLTNAVPLNFSIAPVSAFTNFFLFSITDTNAAALFEIYNLSTNITLVTDVGLFPTPVVFFAAASGTPTNPAQIVIRTNAFFPSLNGDWYLAVDNLQYPAAVLNFTIRAVVSTNGILPGGLPLAVTITPAPPPSTGLIFTWNSVIGETYRIEASTDLLTWTILDTVVATDVTTSWQDPNGLNLPFLFYRIIQVPTPPPP
jgi:hypothetical protein